ncbi:helix-turn-helix transcriptional regulator [Marinicrinis lubricantis]|uniref:AraC family transcriptional regulator n=1 Tax=Marinicrinis lubricantis TaxID=2086470 RepID=A0ABW1IVS8_9BACL
MHYPTLGCEVLSSGYSYHTKPFQAMMKEGFPFYLIRIQTEGFSRSMIDGDMVQIVPGDLLFIAPSNPYILKIEEEQHADGHSYISSGDYFIFFKGEWIDAWWSRVKPKPKYRVPLDGDIVQLLKQLTKEQRKLGQRSAEILDYLCRVLLLTIEHALTEQPLYSGNSFIAYQMKQFVQDHAFSTFKLSDVAEHVGISVSRAVHLFKEVYGVSIMQYALDVRLDMAKERIVYSLMTLEHIAESCGFQNYTYFHRVFKRKYGVSPKQFRGRNNEGERAT